MGLHRKLERLDVPEGADTPLSFAASRRDTETLEMVRRALQHNETLLAYQPVMNVEAADGIAFHEGFIRILDPTGRIIPARDFMPRVEDDEIGREIDCASLSMGLRALSRHDGLRLSINMSARSIGYKKWNRILKRNLDRQPRIGERLMLEISEKSAMSMPEIVSDFMSRLHPHGIAFALDDFGGGHVAPRYFRQFQFDAIKIDGQFVRGVDRDADNQALVRGLIGFAREFDMVTIAESVETQAEAVFLAESGVECLQGYLFGAPTVRPPWQHKTAGT